MVILYSEFSDLGRKKKSLQFLFAFYILMSSVFSDDTIERSSCNYSHKQET